MDAVESIELNPLAFAQMAGRPDEGLLAQQADHIKSSAPNKHSDAKLKKLAKDFESVLLTKLFDQVQESIGGWGPDEQDGTSKQVQGLFWLYLSQDVADKGGFGLWREIYEQLRRPPASESVGERVNEGR